MQYSWWQTTQQSSHEMNRFNRCFVCHVPHVNVHDSRIGGSWGYFHKVGWPEWVGVGTTFIRLVSPKWVGDGAMFPKAGVILDVRSIL